MTKVEDRRPLGEVATRNQVAPEVSGCRGHGHWRTPIEPYGFQSVHSPYPPRFKETVITVGIGRHTRWQPGHLHVARLGISSWNQIVPLPQRYPLDSYSIERGGTREG